jgi:nucleoside-diphosphate-sugar epimerase
MPPAVLVLGGSGFLGQYVVEELTRGGEYNVVVVCNDGGSSFSSSATSSSPSVVASVPGNLATGEGLLEALVEAARLGRPGPGQPQSHSPGAGLAAVVNCAALSSPAECERDPERSRAVNVPGKLVAACNAFARATSLPDSECPCCRERPPPFLVQLSTDQIYAGGREGAGPEAASLWREEEAEKRVPDGRAAGADEFNSAAQDGDDESGHLRDFDPESPAVRPCNAYARQKVSAELLLARAYPRSVCLRSSVMFGTLPRDKRAVKGMRFLQFCDEAIKRSAAAAAAAAAAPGSDAAAGGATSASFFDDEFRSFVAVADVARAVAASVRMWGLGDGLDRGACALLPCAVNVGGPERLSRAEFARLVAAARGLDPGLVEAVPSAAVARAVPSPRDISMCVSRLEELLGAKPLSVAEALKDMPPEEEERGEEAAAA